MSTLIVRVLLRLWRVVPEATLRNALRRGMYRFRVGIPRELLINPGDTVVQVGMWRLENLRRAVRAVGPTGRLLLIEASADAASAASAFFEENRLTQCTVVNAAAWHEAGMVEFTVPRDPAAAQVVGVGAAVTESSEPLRVIKVAAVTVDGVCEKHGISAIDYLEVTVNGAEIDVLRGAESMLRTTRRVLAAGMMRDRLTNEPMNKRVRAHLQRKGFRAVISRRGRVIDAKWGRIDGHVFAHVP